MHKTLIIALALASSCNGQTVTLEHQGHSAMGFNTTAGFITVAHFHFSSGFADHDLDLKIDSIREGDRFRIGSGRPAYFVDRRGTRHELNVVRSSRHEWQTDVMFFSGESGLPVFNRKGLVVGVVKGNELEPLQSGLVARLGALRIPSTVRDRFSLPRERFRVAPASTFHESAVDGASLGLQTAEALPSSDEKEYPTSGQTLFGSLEPVKLPQSRSK